MATLVGATYPTLADRYKAMDPDGTIADVIELVSKEDEVLQDLIMVEGNLPTGNQATVRTGLPSGTWRRLYGGVQPSKSTRAQIIDTCGMFEQFSKIDVDEANLNGQSAEFRLSEAKAHLEAMKQEIVETLFYGNQGADPSEFTGLAPRYSDTTAENGRQIVLADGSGGESDNTSIWCVCWGSDTMHGIYPKGSMGGMMRKDLGERLVTEGDGAMWLALVEQYQWKIGFQIKDWRYASRIANIDVAALLAYEDATDTAANLPSLMTRALGRIHTMNKGRCVFYANKDTHTALTIMAANKSNVQLSINEFAGKPITSFMGYPIRRCDSILNTEELVS